MIKKIDKDNKIFFSIEFEQDKVLFSEFLNNFTNSSVELYSDEENYIFCRGLMGTYNWLWTRDKIGIDVYNEVKELIDDKLSEYEKEHLICKSTFYDQLKENNSNIVEDFGKEEIIILTCNNLRRPPLSDGNIYTPNIFDVNTLATFFLENCLEMNRDIFITKEDAKKIITKIVEKSDWEYRYNHDSIYVWKNNKKEILCMAFYSSVDNYAIISNVYSPIVDRDKGYESNLIYQITLAILDEQMIPIVFLNKDNLSTIGLYKNCGYKVFGKLINFNYSNSKIKIRGGIR